jgi:mRNA interferase MazF
VSGPPYVPQQGDLIWLSRDPRVGHEQSGDRPALVLSQRDFSAVTGFAMVAPITSHVRGWPFEVRLPDGSAIAGVALVDQTLSVDFTARHARYGASATQPVLLEALAKLAAIVEPAGAKR